MSTRSTRMRNVLLAGFAPFDGAAGNPSWDAARALDGEEIAGHRVVARRLPVEFGVARDALRRAIRETRPTLVLCTGLAAGRDAISIERVAINVDDARIPDNAGRQPVDLPVVRGGPAAYFSTLPIKAMYAAIHEAAIPVEVSQSAGTYVCTGCGSLLFTAETKFDARCGWPAFYDAADHDTVTLRRDSSLGMARVEVLCATCGGHLGHLFEGEGFDTPTDQRYCINATSLRFIPDEPGVDD